MKFQKGSVRRSLRYSLYDGLFTAMMVGISEVYFVPYGIALGAKPAQVGLLVALPLVVAALLQTKSARVTQSIGSRTRLINAVVFFHALAWLPIIGIPYFLPAGMGHWAPWTLVAAVTVFASFGAFAVPAWQSLLSDYIPVKKRGKYFGWRNRLQGFCTVAASIVSGFVLHHFGKASLDGFTAIFIFAMVCRFLAWACLTQMVEPFRKSSHDVYFSFFNFVRQFRTSNFAKFAVFVAFLNCAANLSGPLLAVFLLKDIGFSYAQYMTVVTAATLSGVVFQGIWGKYGDLFGNIRVIKVAGWGVAVIPVFWLVSHDIRYLLFVQILAGCVWGGFNLLTVNFILEAVSPGKRIRCLSYFNVVNSLLVLLGAWLGGRLLPHFPSFLGYPFLGLFLVSGAARALVMLFLAKRVQEVRTAEIRKIDSAQALNP